MYSSRALQCLVLLWQDNTTSDMSAACQTSFKKSLSILLTHAMVDVLRSHPSPSWPQLVYATLFTTCINNILRPKRTMHAQYSYEQDLVKRDCM